MKRIEIKLKIDPDIKSGADLVFKQLGITTTEAIRMFLQQSINSHGLPFRPHMPKVFNEDTLQAIHELDEGEGTKITFNNLKNLDL